MRSIIALSLLLLPTQGFAAPPAKPTAPAQPSKKICKVDPEDTESRIRRRICKTEAEWNRTKGQKAEAPAEEAGNSQGGE